MASQFNRLTKGLALSFKVTPEAIEGALRQATHDDLDRLVELRRAVFGELPWDDRRYLAWRYLEYPGSVSNFWVWDFQGTILGGVGAEPIRVQCNGDIVEGVRTYDMSVDPAFDHRGIGAWLAAALQERFDCVISMGGNDRAASMLSKLFRQLPAFHYYKCVFRTRQFLESKLPVPGIRLLAPLADQLLTTYYRWRWWQLRRSTAHLTFQSAATIEALIAQLPAATGTLGKVKMLRSADYLRWRFGQCPRDKYFARMLLQDGKLAGYMIYSFPQGKSQQGKRAAIVEWELFVADSAGTLLATLFADVMQQCLRAAVSEVSAMMNDAESVAAARLAGMSLRNINDRFFVSRKGAEESDGIYRLEDWFLTSGDMDNV